MGLLVVAAIVALALTLLALVAVALVQLVLLVTVRNMVLAVAAVGVYWVVDARRRQVAKGFYSCTQVPGSTDGIKQTTAKTTALQRPRQREAKATDTSASRRATRHVDEDEEKRRGPLSMSQPQRSAAPAGTGPSTTATSHENTAEDTTEERHSIASNASDTEPSADVAPVAVAQPRTQTTSPMRLPDLRHRKWKHPTRSVPLAPKGESLLQENRKPHSERSASNSPRRPERYSSPRSVAMEQKLMKSALESDGYWIGDFRVPAPALSKRTTSSGASPPTPSAPKMTSAASFSTGSTTATSSTTTTPSSKTTHVYRRSNSYRV